jgi:amino acid permease
LILKRIFVLRALLLLLIYSLTIVSTDISVVFGVVGSFFGPILGLIMPVWLVHSYARIKKREVNLKKKIHDWIFVFLSVIILFIGIIYSVIHEQESSH